jgi:hypothetical protein
VSVGRQDVPHVTVVPYVRNVSAAGACHGGTGRIHRRKETELPTAFSQLGAGAFGKQAAVFQHEDMVAGADRTDPVSDENDGHSMLEVVNGVHHRRK